jgi:hypothetical protein
MPTKRTPLNRARTPRIDAGTLELFKELLAVPEAQRDDDFQERERILHRQLGVAFTWLCASVSVLDDRPNYCHPDSVHFEGVQQVLALRQRLRELAGMTKAKATLRKFPKVETVG